MHSSRPRSVPPTRISDLEDSRVFARLSSRLRQSYPPKTVQHESDLTCLARLIWQSDRLANLIETDLNHRLKSQFLRHIADPSLRLLKATTRALACREHFLMCKLNEANLRSIHSLVSRVEKWNAASQ